MLLPFFVFDEVAAFFAFFCFNRASFFVANPLFYLEHLVAVAAWLRAHLAPLLMIVKFRC